MRVYLKIPKGRRKSYALYQRTTNSDGKTKNTTIDSPELKALNSSDLPQDIKLKNALVIKAQIEKRLGLDKGVVVHNEDNERIFKEYWDKYKRRDLVDPMTAKYKYRRALKALGNVSLVSASAEEIEDTILSKDYSRDKKRALFGSIKLLLRFIKRDLELNIPKEDKKKVKYIPEEEFLKKLSLVEDEYLKNLFYVLFYTGMRLGEAFGISDLKLRPDQRIILVDTQLDKKQVLRLPKNGKTRKAFVKLHVFPILRKWVEMKSKFPYSRVATNKRFKHYFGQDLTIHDLRHSYAISLLSKGVSMAHVSQSIGNSVKVCEKYYVGFELVDESIELMRKIVGE